MTDPAEAAAFLALLIGWRGGRVPVYVDGETIPSRWLAADSVSRLGTALHKLGERLDRELSAQVEIGLPRPAKLGVIETTVLWAWVESRDQVRRAHKGFKPPPTMVFRMGGSCRRLLLWGLREPMDVGAAEAANRRIAYALRASQKYANGGNLLLPVPGTFLRVGRKKPSPVLVTRAELEVYTTSQVVAGLREPPVPFMQRVREGKVEIRR